MARILIRVAALSLQGRLTIILSTSASSPWRPWRPEAMLNLLEPVLR